jgi:predicted DNA-binding transcriptional regulator AlpA
METKIRVMSIKGVCEIFNCSRMTFYNKYSQRLTPVPNVSGRILYREEEVLGLKEKVEKDKEFLIVK